MVCSPNVFDGVPIIECHMLYNLDTLNPGWVFGVMVRVIDFIFHILLDPDLYCGRPLIFSTVKS